MVAVVKRLDLTAGELVGVIGGRYEVVPDREFPGRTRSPAGRPPCDRRAVAASPTSSLAARLRCPASCACMAESYRAGGRRLLAVAGNTRPPALKVELSWGQGRPAPRRGRRALRPATIAPSTQPIMDAVGSLLPT